MTVHLPVVAAYASNATITDVDGNTFVDFVGGVGVLNVGHTHPRVVDAIQEQAALFPAHGLHRRRVRGVRRARRAPHGLSTPITGPTRAAFFNAGTEAVENAVKFARLRTGRPAVIAFEGGISRADDAGADHDVEDTPVQDRPRPVRPRGLPRTVPERLSRAECGRGARPSRSDVADARGARRRRGDRLRAAAGRRGLPARAGPSSWRGSEHCATSTASSSSQMRCRQVSGAPAACSRWSTSPWRPT